MLKSEIRAVWPVRWVGVLTVAGFVLILVSGLVAIEKGDSVADDVAKHASSGLAKCAERSVVHVLSSLLLKVDTIKKLVAGSQSRNDLVPFVPYISIAAESTIGLNLSVAITDESGVCTEVVAASGVVAIQPCIGNASASGWRVGAGYIEYTDVTRNIITSLTLAVIGRLTEAGWVNLLGLNPAPDGTEPTVFVYDTTTDYMLTQNTANQTYQLTATSLLPPGTQIPPLGQFSSSSNMVVYSHAVRLGPGTIETLTVVVTTTKGNVSRGEVIGLAVLLLCLGVLLTVADIMGSGYPWVIISEGLKRLGEYDTAGCMEKFTRIPKFLWLGEGGRVCTTMKAVSGELAVYKLYLPRTVLDLDLEGHYEDDDFVGSTLESGKSHRSMSFGKNVLQVLSLPHGCVLILRLPLKPDDSRRFRSALEIIDSALVGSNGTLHPIPTTEPDSLCLSWGVTAPCMTPCISACRSFCCIKLPGLIGGLGYGRIQAGNVGCSTIRGFVLVGQAVETAYAAVELAKEIKDKEGQVAVMSVTAQHAVSSRYRTVPVGVIGMGGRVSVYYGLTEAIAFDDDAKEDWMLRVEAATNASHEQLASLINSIITNKATTAEIDAFLATPPDTLPSTIQHYVLSRLRAVRASPTAFIQKYCHRSLLNDVSMLHPQPSQVPQE
eukprot:TRINITY_DN10464_c0_g1_i1.p1 TRINITY_DN10464_c0_g1~~TRINITY_DN10464_c0_g1_i1.p1  ORF type:complete len:663 (+),score=161.24 TRINITY_DN10464_c0_g1_i1:118-2106(+)